MQSHDMANPCQRKETQHTSQGSATASIELDKSSKQECEWRVLDEVPMHACCDKHLVIVCLFTSLAVLDNGVLGGFGVRERCTGIVAKECGGREACFDAVVLEVGAD